jgi:putative phosphoribosyl transferase
MGTKSRSAPGVTIAADGVQLEGELSVPPGSPGVAVFAHGSGSSRNSPRNRYVAEALETAGFGVLLFDLLTAEEEHEERLTRHLRFDIGLLARRLSGARTWLGSRERTRELPVGYFGASTGAAAALVAAARHPEGIAAIVSRGGRPDLAGAALSHVRAPTLLIVGGEDGAVIDLNRAALAQLEVEKRLVIVPGAGHLFAEPGTLEDVTQATIAWFARHLTPTAAASVEERSRWM